MDDIMKINETRQALRWLSRELAWERVLTSLRSEDAETAERAAA